MLLASKRYRRAIYYLAEHVRMTNVDSLMRLDSVILIAHIFETTERAVALDIIVVSEKNRQPDK